MAKRKTGTQKKNKLESDETSSADDDQPQSGMNENDAADASTNDTNDSESLDKSADVDPVSNCSADLLNTIAEKIDRTLDSKAQQHSQDVIELYQKLKEQGIEGVKVPSDAYEASRSTLVYRLSEAMFASLLATYIIGFVSFLGPLWSIQTEPEQQVVSANKGRDSVNGENAAEPSTNQVKDIPWSGFLPKNIEQSILKSVSLLSVSLVFAFLTATIYLTYNSSVLTMASYNQDDGARDFSFAVFQGLSFGVCLVFFPIMPLMVGGMLIGSQRIKRMEHNSLVDFLRTRVFGAQHDATPAEEKRENTELNEVISKIISEHGQKEWRTAPFEYLIPLVLIVAGACTSWISLYWDSEYGLPITALVNVAVCLGTIIASYRVMKKSSLFMQPTVRGEIQANRQFVVLMNEILEEKNNRST